MNIGIISDQVRSKSESFRGNGLERYQDMRKFLDSVIYNELPELWQGSGSEAYVNRYRELEPSFQAMEKLINDIADGLNANASFYEQADAEAAKANAGGNSPKG